MFSFDLTFFKVNDDIFILFVILLQVLVSVRPFVRVASYSDAMPRHTSSIGQSQRAQGVIFLANLPLTVTIRSMTAALALALAFVMF